MKYEPFTGHAGKGLSKKRKPPSPAWGASGKRIKKL